jgi:hypothetical protein
MTGVIATIPRIQFFDIHGSPLIGGKLYTYVAGSTTPVETYQDQALTAKNKNPVELDFTGSCSIWLDPAKNYKFVLKGPLGATQPGWPVDNISGAGTPASLAGIFNTFTTKADLADDDGADKVGHNGQTVAAALDSLGARVDIVIAGSYHAKKLADALSKGQTGAPLTVACYGDSITYGQDTSGSAVANSQINGAPQTRSAWQFPECLGEALRLSGYSRATRPSRAWTAGRTHRRPTSRS